MNDQQDKAAPDLEPLYEATLSPDDLRGLLRDIACDGKDIDIQTRPPGPFTIGQLGEALAEGSLSHAQIRYTYRDEPWCDTILTQPTGFRVIRIRQPPH